jgi:hypothetical protein
VPAQGQELTVGTDESGNGYPANVFVNCPFDEAYLPLLRPLLFTIVYLGFSPRIASETFDSGENRLAKICRLIHQSRFSIHDLSRLQAAKAREYFRLNMPFELGIDYAVRHFGSEEFRDKKCLILERNTHELKRALSDMAGVDVKSHRNEPDEVVRAVRDWFVEALNLKAVPTGTIVWWDFNKFTSAFYEKMLAAGSPRADIDTMPVPEYIGHIREWIVTEGV